MMDYRKNCFSSYILENSTLNNRIFIDERNEVTSTNDLLIEKANTGEKEGSLITALYQSSGKGRKGRTFYSPKTGNIYFSLLLRPEISINESLMITVIAALSVSYAYDKISGKTSYIKWVNDIFVDGKKACGILTEASIDPESGMLSYAVLGVGMNVFPFETGLPAELKNIAGTLYTDEEALCFGENDKCQIRCRLLEAFLERFFDLYDNIKTREFMNEYRKKSLIIGKNVTYYDAKRSNTVFVKDINDSGELVVVEDGMVKTYNTGEISIKM